MERIKKYKILLILVVIVAIGLAIFFVANKNKVPINNPELEVKDLPLKIESTPLSLNIVEENNIPVLEATYTNDSDEIISRLVLEIMLKDTGEIIQMKCNDPVGVGQVSSRFTGKAPESRNIDDVKVLKYKISVRSGIYMEYDTELRQYNWS